MRYLAVKNKDGTGKAVCICNTSNELDDMASMFRDFEWKVFEEYEEKEALKWSGLNKVVGFKLEEEKVSGFEKILQLLRQKGFSYVKIELTNKEIICATLDDLYCISAEELLSYNPLIDRFTVRNYGYFACPKDLTEYIDAYYKDSHIKDKEDAIEDYFDECWRQLGGFPWQHIPKTNVTVNDNMIFFEKTYNNISREFSEIYYLSKRKEPIVLPITSILSITPQTLDYEIFDEDILDVIKRM